MAGRPKKTFTQSQIKQIDDLALRGLKDNAIAVKMEIDGETFRVHFQERCRKKRIDRHLMLLDLQTEKAKAGDSTMLVWLGKNELEQTDKQETKHGITDELADLLKEISGDGTGLPIRG